jgi:hypothetical protein
MARMPTDQDMNRDLQIVRARKLKVAEELASIDRRRRELDQEANDLAVTERTLARLLSVELPDMVEVPDHRPDVARRRKPKGIPSVYTMTATILRESNDVHERRWLEAQDIVQLIRAKWWPNAESTDITPTLWRLSKTDKLLKRGSQYALPAIEIVMSAASAVSPTGTAEPGNVGQISKK